MPNIRPKNTQKRKYYESYESEGKPSPDELRFYEVQVKE